MEVFPNLVTFEAICVTSGKLINLSVGIYLMGWLYRLKALIHMKHFKQGPDLSKCYFYYGPKN